jgi:hypothetical protein
LVWIALEQFALYEVHPYTRRVFGKKFRMRIKYNVLIARNKAHDVAEMIGDIEAQTILS